MNDLIHITYASRECYHLHRLLTSAAHWGISVQVLGMNEPWEGFLQKLAAVRRFLAGLPGDRMVLFTDAYDTIYLQPGPVMERQFHTFDRPVVFSAEMSFHAPGNETIAARYPPSPTIYRYLNSGGFIGFAAPLAKVLARILADPQTDDDQSLLSRYFLDHPDEIALDYRSELFVNTSNRQYDEDLECREGRLYNRQTGTWPCILHTPGKYYGVLEFYSLKLPFYRDIEWSRLSLRTAGHLAACYFNLKAYRHFKRWGWVKNQDDFSLFLTKARRRT
jgi:hypothetical protein